MSSRSLDVSGNESLIDYTSEYKVGETYFRADRFCRYQHETIAGRRAIRQGALDRASGSSVGQVIPVHERESFIYTRTLPRSTRLVTCCGFIQLTFSFLTLDLAVRREGESH